MHRELSTWVRKKDIVDLSSLKQHLEHELSLLRRQHSGLDPTVVLSVDRNVPYDAFLRLFSITQECCSKLRLVYQPEEMI